VHGVAITLEPLASQAIGAGDPHRAWLSLLATLRTCALVWLPSMLAGYAFTWVLAPLGIELAAIERSREFFLWQAPGMGFRVLPCRENLPPIAREDLAALLGAVVANVINFLRLLVGWRR